MELLARTGMRAGELGGLLDDAMYRVGDTWWLRIPLGKLHNDRNVPLHPLLVGLITDYQAWRGPSRGGFLLERDDGQPFDRRTATWRPWHVVPAWDVSILTSFDTRWPPSASTAG